jgi:hypothetical protein
MVGGLGAVAVGVEEEGAVVIRPVPGPRPGRAVVAMAGLGPGASEAVGMLARGRDEAGGSRRVTGFASSAGAIEKSSHSASASPAWVFAMPSAERTVS